MRLTTASLLVSNNLSLSSNFVFADSLMMIQPHHFKMQHTYKFKFDFVSLRISGSWLWIQRWLHSSD